MDRIPALPFLGVQSRLCSWGASSSVGRVLSKNAARYAVLIAVAALTSCAKQNQPETTLAVVRITEDMGDPFSKLLIVGVGRDNEHRRIYEYSMRDALIAKGASAEVSYKLFPQSDILSERELVGAVSGGDFDAVVITRVVWVSDQMEYVPGETRRVPTSEWDSFTSAPSRNFYVGSYQSSYEVVHTPGYYQRNIRYSVETMLFSMPRDGMKVWSALSETVNPESPETLINQITSVVAQAMEDQGLVK